MATKQMASKDFKKQHGGYGLTTAQILYRRPDHQWLLQTYVWQNYDLFPKFPELQRFLAFWIEKLEGPAAFGDGGALAADQAGRVEGDRRRIPVELISQPTLRCPAALVFGRPGCPSLPFSFSLKRGDGAPGRRRSGCEAPLAGLGSAARRAPRVRVPVTRGPRLRGARARCGRGPAPPGAPRGDVIVGHRTSLRHPTPRSTTPSMSEAVRMISANSERG